MRWSRPYGTSSARRAANDTRNHAPAVPGRPASIAAGTPAMRIVYLHQYFLTPDMAGGTRSYEMARRLVAAGHDVHMVTTDQRGAAGRRWRESSEAGIVVHWAAVRYDNRMSFGRRMLAFVRFAFMAAQRAASLRGDIVFATSTPLTIVIPALVASTLGRVPFVFEVRDMWPDVPIALGAIRGRIAVGLARWLERLAYRRAAHVVALAPGMRDDIIAKGIPPGKISVIPNGCDLDVFAGATDARAARDSNAWLGDRPLVLYAGAVGMANGVHFLVEVARAALALDPEIRFAVFGAGRDFDSVRDLARRKGVLDVNFFMHDPVPKRQLAQWLAAANMLVALFTGPRVVWKDAVQNKFFDALAAGKPIANNFDGWQSRIATDADIGLILDPNDPARAAQKVVRALRDASWLDGVPARARRLAEGEFNRDRLGARLAGILETAARRQC